MSLAKRKKPMSCNQLSLEHLRAQGYLAETVEKRLPRCMITKDLFGFIDIIAVRRDEVLGVQATSSANVAARIAKIASHDNVAAVRESGMRIVVHGWRKTRAGPVLRVEDVS